MTFFMPAASDCPVTAASDKSMLEAVISLEERYAMRWQLVMLKSFHTGIFLFMSGCILYVIYCGAVRRYDWTLGLALGALTLEIIVFLGNGRRCPLTDLALKYGDSTGNDWIADIFLPRWAAQMIVPVSSLLLILGLVLLVINRVAGAA